jgi:hypothetical protein
MKFSRITEKDARRGRVVTLVAWIAAAASALMVLAAILHSNPTLKVHAVAVVLLVIIALLGRRAPLGAAVALLVSTSAHIYIFTTVTGTGVGAPMFYWTAAGLAVALLGTQRILLVACLGVLTAVPPWPP